MLATKIRIGKKFTFDSAHQLQGAVYGKCSNLHGHTYQLTVEVEGHVTEDGWLTDFSEIKKIVEEVVLKKYDHQYLNKFFTLPTAEMISLKIAFDLSSQIKKLNQNIRLSKVILFETPTSYCEVECFENLQDQ